MIFDDMHSLEGLKAFYLISLGALGSDSEVGQPRSADSGTELRPVH